MGKVTITYSILNLFLYTSVYEILLKLTQNTLIQKESFCQINLVLLRSNNWRWKSFSLSSTQVNPGIEINMKHVMIEVKKKEKEKTIQRKVFQE